MTQTEFVMDYIKQNGSITTAEAFYHLGISRLPARINDLEKEGYRFSRVAESGKARTGRKTSWVRYSLKEQ